jgi:hypothetical protein
MLNAPAAYDTRWTLGPPTDSAGGARAVTGEKGHPGRAWAQSLAPFFCRDGATRSRRCRRWPQCGLLSPRARLLRARRGQMKQNKARQPSISGEPQHHMSSHHRCAPLVRLCSLPCVYCRFYYSSTRRHAYPYYCTPRCAPRHVCCAPTSARQSCQMRCAVPWIE